MVARAHRRYGLVAPNTDVTAAWTLLAEGAYSLDLWGMDSGGVSHIPGTNYNNYAWQQEGARPCTAQHCDANYSHPVQPTPMMCTIWKAWGSFIAAGPRMAGAGEPWNYDLVNVGTDHATWAYLALWDGSAPPCSRAGAVCVTALPDRSATAPVALHRQ